MSDFQHKKFSIQEAADHLRISRAFVWKLIAQKRLRPLKIGARTILTGAEIERFLREENTAA
jgi:excisionase family DNA binding protein